MVGKTTSAIYECNVMHHRLTPKVHRFSYRVFYLWLDLDELRRPEAMPSLLGLNRFHLFSFYDCDHLGGGGSPVKERLLAWLVQQQMDTTQVHQVRMLTFPRVLGYIFNPVCFFFCYDKSGDPLWVVSQVTNTYKEQKLYLLDHKEPDGRFRLVTPKHFYVSPFSALDLCFDFKIRAPGEKLDIHINDRQGDELILLSSLTGERRPLHNRTLVWFLFKYPLLTLRVIFLIHWQAFLLWKKKLPVFRKAARPDLQREVLRPHPSISDTTSKP
jgi:hypothetical protein